MTRQTHNTLRVRRILAVLLLVCLAAAVAVAVWGMLDRPMGRVRAQVLLTFVGLAVGLLVALVQVRSANRWARLLVAGLAAVIVSQASYLLLVWTGWNRTSALWRIWWLSMVPSVNITHLLLLRASARGARGRLEWLTGVAAVAAGALTLTLGLPRTLLSEVARPWLWVGAALYLLATIGTIAVIVRALRGRVRLRPLPLAVKIVLILLTHAVLFAGGWYVGHRGQTPADPFAALPSAMANLPPEQVAAQTDADLARLRTVSAGLAELCVEMEQQEAQLRATLDEQGREYLLPAEDDRLRWQFVTYLSYRSALRRIIAAYSGFQAVRDPALRARCFLLAHAAAMTTHEAGLRLLYMFRDRPVERRKLNEPEPAWGIPADMFDSICESAASRRDARLLEEMDAYRRHKTPHWRDINAWSEADLDWLATRIDAAQHYARQHRLNPELVQVETFVARVKQDAYSPVYAVQSVVSEWIGDTRIVQRPPLVSTERIDRFQGQLRPGDILLERRNWFLSNAFLPGFWPHAALYVGTVDDLKRLGIADAPAVREHLAEFARPAADGRGNTVIEAVSEGVVFNSLQHSCHADYVAVLRPRLSDQQIARAIVTAFGHKGKPYDFGFDFFTSDKLVCTELVYRCYEGLLHLPLKRVMGRDTLPAVEIVRKFADERGKADRQLDFVLFLDADPDAKTVRDATADDLCQSVNRPRSFNE